MSEISHPDGGRSNFTMKKHSLSQTAGLKKHKKTERSPRLLVLPLNFIFRRPFKPPENSLIGKDTQFEGKLTFRDEAVIIGHFKGEISAAGKLIVDPTGVVTGDIHVGEVMVGGEVHGHIRADRRIEVLETGKVYGNIEAPETIINQCAVFKGNCRSGLPGKSQGSIIDLNSSIVEKHSPGKSDLSEDGSGKMSAENR